jgi:hypothetical protein
MTMDLEQLTLDIEQFIDVAAAPAAVFEGLIRQLTEGNVMVPLRLERWPGGRWYRDLGDGAGHLWGFVQVYKPPTLLEIHGPLFMSYPVAGHVQFRLTPQGGGTRIALRHRALGLIAEDHRKNVHGGWLKILQGVRPAEGQ